MSECVCVCVFNGEDSHRCILTNSCKMELKHVYLGTTEFDIHVYGENIMNTVHWFFFFGTNINLPFDFTFPCTFWSILVQCSQPYFMNLSVALGFLSLSVCSAYLSLDYNSYHLTSTHMQGTVVYSCHVLITYHNSLVNKVLCCPFPLLPPSFPFFFLISPLRNFKV